MGRRQALLIAALAFVASAPAEAASCRLSTPDLTVTWKAPSTFIEREPYRVSIEISMLPGEPSLIAAWMLTPSAFTLNGRPLGKRDDPSMVTLVAGTKLEVSIDLESAIRAADNWTSKSFELGFGTVRGKSLIAVTFVEAAERGIEFTTLPLEQLQAYEVVFVTSQGIMRAEMWPQFAPNHVRNFLDLAYTGFYDGTLFNRVIEGNLIQGGKAKTGSAAPRTIVAEFNAERHVPGVLSMARGDDVNSAQCEFFIMHGKRPDLDGKYTTYGKLLGGMEVLDRIAASGNKSYRPIDPQGHVPPVDQVIQKVIVIKKPARRQDEQR